MRLGIGLRNEAGLIQEKLDDLIETIQAADNSFLLFKLSQNQKSYDEFLRQVQLANVDIEQLLYLNQNAPEVFEQFLILRNMMMDKVDFSRRLIIHQEFGHEPRLKAIMTVRDDLLMTKQIRERISIVDRLVVRKLKAHQEFVDRYYGIILSTVTLSLVGAGIFFVVFGFLVSNEIRRRTLLEVDLRKAQSVAIKASELKSQFLATVSHEIRTPLNGILGMSELILKRSKDSEVNHLSNIIWNSGKTLLRIVNDLLDFSKIEANKIQFELQEESIAQIFESAIALFAKMAEEKGLLLYCYYSPACKKKYILDATRLGQVLHNLLSNAIKFTEEGAVNVLARIEPGPARPKLLVKLCDTGPGIPQNKRQFLFQPFFQLENAKAHEGTGLGLSISQKIISAMGGDIGYHFDDKLGSCFWFEVPLTSLEPTQNQTKKIENPARQPSNEELVAQRDRLLVALNWAGENPHLVAFLDLYLAEYFFEIPRDLEAHAPPQQGRPVTPWLLTPDKMQWSFDTSSSPPVPIEIESASIGKSALVVDDNSTNQLYARSLMEGLGFRVRSESNGADALKALEQASFDIILMDCRMPGQSGVEVTKKWREKEWKEKRGRQLIIAMTANVMSEDKEVCLAAGMDDFLAKPFQIQELVGILEKWKVIRPTENSSPKLKQIEIVNFEESEDFDPQVLQALESKTNAQVVKKLKESLSDSLARFQQELDEIYKSCSTDATSLPREKISNIAHQLKSSAAVVGFKLLALKSAAIEEMADGKKGLSQDQLKDYLETMSKAFVILTQLNQDSSIN